ncbi:MAG: Fur family transcriptional regulator [Candidatus Limnocylindrus sp.]
MAEEMLDALDRAGVRLTGPRRKLAALIERREGHFTAADLLKDAGRRRMGIGRATVFRLLELLSEQGLVERIDLPDGTHAYIPCEPTHHHHLVCLNSGATTDVDDCGIEAVTREAARRSGFKIEQHRLELFGRCPDCRSAN